MERTEIPRAAEEQRPPAEPQAPTSPIIGATAASDGDGTPCPTCSQAQARVPPTFVYALGQIEPRFPRLSIEKEFAQASGRAETADLTDREVLLRVLQENRYLLHQLCWVVTIHGVETYIVIPRDPGDVDLLLGTFRSTAGPGDIDLVVGVRGPLAPPELCNGLIVPILIADQIYSFGRDELLSAIPRPEGISAERFVASSAEVFDRVMQWTDNAGATDAHRALNYLAVRYPAIYGLVGESHGRKLSLTAVDVRRVGNGGTRGMVDVVLSLTNRVTDVVEKHFVRVDVTEEFPFLVRKLSPYYDVL